MTASPRLQNQTPAASARTRDHIERSLARRAALSVLLEETLPRQQPIVWEVGCGHGHFLTAYASRHPGELCVGIDIVRDRIQRAKRKRDRARLPHLYFILADAEEFLSSLPKDVRFSSVYILFPDPWPKRRHHKNRLMQQPVLDAMAERANPDARIFFRTDYQPYYLGVSALVDAHPAWEIVQEPWPFETQTVFQARAPHYFSLIARRAPTA